MRDGGLFKTKVVEYCFSRYNEPIHLFLPADIHHNSSSHAKSSFAEFLDEANGTKEQKLFLLLGDCLDTCSDSERRFLVGGGLHDDSNDALERAIWEDTQKLIDEIKPVMKDRCIGVIEGNHRWHFEDGTTTEQQIARALNAPFLGDAACIFLILRFRGTPHTHEVVIFAHHGSSDARLNSLGSHVDADLVIGAHTHRCYARPDPKIKFKRTGRGVSVIHHETRIVRAKSFLRAYVDGKRSYAIRRAYSPSSIGCAKVTITPRRVEKDKAKDTYHDARWIDIKAVV